MPRTIDIVERKQIMLVMMDWIDSFCRANTIKYFLYGGSLIGAIRHKGYIPWDDDIDICMMRADYDRFLFLFNDPDGRYRLITPDNNSAYYLPTAKVYDDTTVLSERISNGIPIGVYIDVFPLDYCSDDFQKACSYGKRIGIYRKIVDIKNISIDPKRSMIKNAALILFKVLVAPFSRRFAIKRICFLSERRKNKPSKYVGQFTKMTYASREIYESKWFDVALNGTFEGRDYIIPKEYDNVLRTEYGEYMVLPPKEKQVTHHVSDAWWKN